MATTRWEYMVVDAGVAALFGPKLDGDALTAHLDALGAEGWEVTGMTSMEAGAGRTRDLVILLKRPRA